MEGSGSSEESQRSPSKEHENSVEIDVENQMPEPNGEKEIELERQMSGPSGESEIDNMNNLPKSSVEDEIDNMNNLPKSSMENEIEPENQMPEPRSVNEINEDNEVTERSAQPSYDWQTRHLAQLHIAALKGNWDAAQGVLANDSTLINARITSGGETVLHIAAVEGHYSFVSNLLDKVEGTEPQIQNTNGSTALQTDLENQNTNGSPALRTYLEIQNTNGSTALCYAAAAGRVDIAKLMVKMDENLPTMEYKPKVKPLYIAVLQGHKEMAYYLFGLSKIDQWKKEERINLLTRSIHAGFYDLATKIVQQYKTPVLKKDDRDETPLQVLATKPLAFSGTRQGVWSKIASKIWSYVKLKARDTSAPSNAHTLLRHLFDSVEGQENEESVEGQENEETSEEDVETSQPSTCMLALLFVAAESGNDCFLVELIQRYPDLIYKKNESEHSIFHIAVLHRYVKVFNFIYELHGVKDLILSYVDKEKRNNILHLAAMLAPPSQLNNIPGAALQMQREILWYKEVEKFVPPSYRNMKNKEKDYTPYELFLEEHKNLMEEGEKQMKQIAKSCMVVTILIATVIFTTALEVPGDNNKENASSLRYKKLLMVLRMSEAIGTLASLTSMLMFLSVLISRYSVNDFLWSLPSYLVVGVAALFVSIVAMMVAFFSWFLFSENGQAAVIVLLVLFASVPAIFVILKGPILINIVRCTCSSKWLFDSNNRLLS